MSDKVKELEEKLELLRAEKEETIDLVDALNELAAELGTADPQRSATIAREAVTLASKVSYEKGEARGLGNMGFAFYMVSDHDAAARNLHKSKTMLEKLDDQEALARVTLILAGVQTSLGNYELAFSHAFDSLRWLRAVGNRYDEGWCLHGIATGYTELGDFDRALDYSKDALKIFEELDHKVGRARALNNIGGALEGQGKHDEALEYHEESLKLFRAAKNKLGEARALNDMGIVYQAVGDLDKAHECHTHSLELRDQVGNRQAKCTSLINLGKLYTEKKDVGEAMHFLHRALTIAMEIRAKPRVYQANLALSEAHALSGDYAEALEHYKIYQQVKEEVTGDAANSKIKNLQIGFEIEKSDREAELSRQADKMSALSTLVAGVVHEMNTPVGAINSALDVTLRCVNNIREVLDSAGSIEELRSSEKLKRAIKILQDDSEMSLTASRRITKIVESLKSFTRLDEAVFQKVDLHEGLESTLVLIGHELSNRIAVKKNYGDLPIVACYPGELNQVFMHLLRNAVQAIEGDGTIAIRTWTKNGKVCVEVSDTGIGISPEQQKRLFDPSFSRKGKRVKAGLGLFTSFNILKRHQGDIDVKSKVGKGTSFTISFPTDLDRTTRN